MVLTSPGPKYEPFFSCDQENSTYVPSEKNGGRRLSSARVKSNAGKKGVYLGLTGILFLLLLLYQSPIYTKINENSINMIIEDELTLPKQQHFMAASSGAFLIFNKKCRIANIEPLNKEIQKYVKKQKHIPCTTYKQLLTSFTNVNESLVLSINTQARKKYSKNAISCCYNQIKRNEEIDRKDCCIITSPKCIQFENQTTVNSSVVMVTCQDRKTKKEIYKNVHTAIKLTKEVANKIENASYTKRPFSVLFIGIDSVSRLNFIRSMPETKKYVDENEWIELLGYNKMEDNTFPNHMAIFTGRNISNAYAKCNPKKVSGLDKCKMIWHSFAKFGYVTAYSEDAASISTFNYVKKGFTKKPTDYYFRPYFIAAEKLKIKRVETLAYCTGPEISGERVLNNARDFTKYFKDHPSFGFFWMNTFSHNEANTVSGMDETVRNFLKDLDESGIRNNTIIVFLSDHGIRFGQLRLTQTGWYEERLPFIYFSIPKRFQEEYQEEYKELLKNTRKLTTPYDLHMTLQDLLVMQGFNHTVASSQGCPNCSSLFDYINTDRACEEAGIEPHWCTCKPFTEVSEKNPLVYTTIEYILDYMQTNILKNESSKCAKFSIKRVLHAKIYSDTVHTLNTTLLVVFETIPEAFFEATVIVGTSHNITKYDFDGNISRLDFYSAHSKCIEDGNLKKYCYCNR